MMAKQMAVLMFRENTSGGWMSIVFTSECLLKTGGMTNLDLELVLHVSCTFGCRVHTPSTVISLGADATARVTASLSSHLSINK